MVKGLARHLKRRIRRLKAACAIAKKAKCVDASSCIAQVSYSPMTSGMIISELQVRG